MAKKRHRKLLRLHTQPAPLTSTARPAVPPGSLDSTTPSTSSPEQPASGSEAAPNPADRLYLRLTQDDGETKGFWASSVEELVTALKAMLRDTMQHGEHAEYPAASTQFEVFERRWGITKLPYPFLVSPDGSRTIPLFDMDFRPEQISQDGYLVERPWSAADEAVLEPQVPSEPVTDSYDFTEAAHAATDFSEAEEEPSAAVVAAENAQDDMFEGEPE